MKKTVIVLGSNSFSGSHFVKHLLENEFQVLGVSRSIEPNEVLRKKSTPVDKVDSDIQKLMDDMLETMYAAPGIGLAAIQVGVPKRIIVLDIAQKEGQKNPMFFINPEIIDKSKNNTTY